MEQIKPNADGTCSRECPQCFKGFVYDTEDYYELHCRLLKYENGDSQMVDDCCEYFIGICPIAYQRLLEVERHARRIREARRGRPCSVVEQLLDQALVAVRDLVGDDNGNDQNVP